MTLRTTRLIAKTLGVLRELSDEVQIEVQAGGGQDAVPVREIIHGARSHLIALVHQAAWQLDLPPGVEPHDVAWNKIPEEVEATQCESAGGTIKDRTRLLIKMLKKHGLPTDCDFDLIEWLDRKLSKGE